MRPPGSAVVSTASTRTVPVRLRKGISMCRAQVLIARIHPIQAESACGLGVL
jgi:hypothetical protein